MKQIIESNSGHGVEDGADGRRLHRLDPVVLHTTSHFNALTTHQHLFRGFRPDINSDRVALGGSMRKMHY